MKKAVVVFSGGQDSTTCLVQALKNFDEVHAITFDYGQRHKLEIEVAQALAKELGVKAHKVMDVGLLNELAISSLTRDDISVSHELQENGLPNSFVPGRNILFLTLSFSVPKLFCLAKASTTELKFLVADALYCRLFIFEVVKMSEGRAF